MKILGLRIFGEYEPQKTLRGEGSIYPVASSPHLLDLDSSGVQIKPLPRPFHPQPINYGTRVWLLAILTGLPGSALGLYLLWAGAFSPKVQWTFTVLIMTVWPCCAAALL